MAWCSNQYTPAHDTHIDTWGAPSRLDSGASDDNVMILASMELALEIFYLTHHQFFCSHSGRPTPAPLARDEISAESDACLRSCPMDAPTFPVRTMTEKEAAKVLGISAATLQRERWRGRIRCIRLSCRIIRYTEQNLLDYLAGRQEEVGSVKTTPSLQLAMAASGTHRRARMAAMPSATSDAIGHEMAKKILGVRTRRDEP